MRISSHLTKTEDSGVEQEEQRVKLLDRWPRVKGQEEGHLEGAERRRERGGRFESRRCWKVLVLVVLVLLLLLMVLLWCSVWSYASYWHCRDVDERNG